MMADTMPKPESHWGPSDPAAQPPRDELLSVSRVVQDTRTRLGPDATAEAVHSDVRARGLKITLDEVRACWG
jgi:hypothetical protein